MLGYVNNIEAKLGNGSRIAVIGAGPAGALFAINLITEARRACLELDVYIFEEKAFSAAGRISCNMCAGILSTSFLDSLAEIGITLPERIILSRISAYQLHTPFGTMEAFQPGAPAPILSIFRGNGPRDDNFVIDVSLDGYLLGLACDMGAQLIRARVEKVDFGPKPRLTVSGKEQEWDLVVLASGANSRLTHSMPAPYQPPPIQRMTQDELWAGRRAVMNTLGPKVHIFLLPGTNLVFGTLVPKREYIGVSLLSRREPAMTIDDFLSYPIVRAVLPGAYERRCGCAPLIAMGPAQHPWGDRFVAIGDAAITRLYKDGIGSAAQTARQAALTVVQHGVSKEAFDRQYAPLYRSIATDNQYGKWLFRINELVGASHLFFSLQACTIAAERSIPYAQRDMDQAIWGMFTGVYSYHSIFRRALSPRLWKNILRSVGNSLTKGRIWTDSKCDPPRPIRILVLGGGFAGIYTTLHLEKALHQETHVSITLVSDENFFLFTPLLHEVATGGIETRHIAMPIRRLRGKRRFDFVQSNIHSVNLEERTVRTNHGDLPYDILVLALGSVTDRSALGNSEGRVFTLKTLRDGIVLRNHVLQMFELASVDAASPTPRLTFVVVGGGTTGVQLAADLQDFTRGSLLKEYRGISPEKVKVILVQSEARLLPELGADLSAIARRGLEAQGVEVITGVQVRRVRPNRIELDNGQVIATHTIVWTPGIMANPVVSALPVPKDRYGRVNVNEFLEVPGQAGVYAMGDNANMMDHNTGEPLPPTAHIAVRQPRAAAANIVASIKGGPKKPYRYLHMGQMVTLGPRSAVADIFGIKTHGFLTRVLWLAAYTSVMMGRYNRIRVFTDWALGLFFGRDSTMLRLRW
jgi:NADH:ubiquinone reductase (H+-translocating)